MGLASPRSPRKIRVRGWIESSVGVNQAGQHGPVKCTMSKNRKTAMSMFQDTNYHWRETCFVYFCRENRPTLRKVLKALETVGPQYQVTNAQADPEGRFESMTVIAPDAFSALDICYLEGPEIQEEVEKQVKELSASDLTVAEQKQLAKLRMCDARFDVFHFERLVEEDDEDDDGMGDFFDPSALIIVLDALSKLTRGIAIDPQSGILL